MTKNSNSSKSAIMSLSSRWRAISLSSQRSLIRRYPLSSLIRAQASVWIKIKLLSTSPRATSSTTRSRSARSRRSVRARKNSILLSMMIRTASRVTSRRAIQDLRIRSASQSVCRRIIWRVWISWFTKLATRASSCATSSMSVISRVGAMLLKLLATMKKTA